MINKWRSNFQDFISHKYSAEDLTYHCVLNDTELLPCDNISDIFVEQVKHRGSKTIEVLYSGGLDSEFVLNVLHQASQPVIALTMEMRVNNMTFNTHDLYYAEKFCRQHGITQKTVVLNVDKFYENGDHLAYVLPYNILQAHVATQLWLLEQASSFPVIGGDWPWLQADTKVISPIRLDFAVGDLFMRDRGITGINNMMNYSLDSCLQFLKQHSAIAARQPITASWGTIGDFKTEIFKNLGYTHESRIKAYGWEAIEIHNELFDIRYYRSDLLKRIGNIKHVIEWQNEISRAANILPGSNDKFK